MIRSLGIDMGSKSLKIAEVHFSSGVRRIVDLVQIPVDREKGPWSALRDFLISRPQKGESLALGLGKTPVIIKKFAFPFKDRAKVEAAIRSDFEDTLPFDLSPYHLNVKQTSKAGKMNEFIAGLCHVDDLEILNKHFEDISLRADHVGVDAEALGQLALHQVLPASAEPRPYLVIDIGNSSTKIAFLRGHRGAEFFKGVKNPTDTLTEIMEMRCLSRGSSEIVEWMADRKNMSTAEAENWLQHRAFIVNDEKASPDVNPMTLETSDEIKTALRPVFVEIYQTLQAFRVEYETAPEVAYVTGGVTQLQGFVEFLAFELRLKVEKWDYFKGFELGQLNLNHSHKNEFALALALAHRFTLSKSSGWINFKKSPVSERKIFSQGIQVLSRPDLRPILGFFVGFWIFLVVYMMASQYLLLEQISDVRKILVSEFQKLDPDLGRKAQRAVIDIDRTKEMFATDVKRRLSRMSAGDSSRAKLEFLLDLSEMLPAKSLIKNVQLETQGMQSRMVSLVTFQESFDDSLVKKLKESLNAEFKERGYSGFELEKNAGGVKIMARWGGPKRGSD